MTFRKERYPVDWKAIRARILVRAGNKCETCRAPNGAWISRWKNWDGTGASLYMTSDEQIFTETGEEAPANAWLDWGGERAVKVVLTVAHLDHVESNNADDNLKALCQRCHLKHDREDNIRRAKATRRSKLAAGDLFDGKGPRP